MSGLMTVAPAGRSELKTKRNHRASAPGVLLSCRKHILPAGDRGILIFVPNAPIRRLWLVSYGSFHEFLEGSVMIFAYFGPETMMPVASIFAAAIGVVLMFGRNVMSIGRGMMRRVWRRPTEVWRRPTEK